MSNVNEIVAFYFRVHPSVSYETIAATLKYIYNFTDEEIKRGYEFFQKTS